LALVVSNVSKSFADKRAISNLSVTVEQGQVFGLLGLNGAGKSTTIRMVLNILQPDSGEITWRGQPTSAVRTRLGYLPEERGLYQQMKVLPHMVFFGRLNGMTKTEAQHSARRWLARFNIQEHANRTVGELSKGNQQKVQFIASVLHHPDLVILDEPFSGLDPVNTSLFKEVFRELVTEGQTIVFSSHRLDHVQELSDAVGIIHQSELVLAGRVDDILAAQPPKWLRVGVAELDSRTKPIIQSLVSCDIGATEHKGLIEVPMDAVNPKALLQKLVAESVEVTHFEYVRPSLNDVFLEKVGSQG
jgi:ABC-2 type transport system ATP-binding protein